MSTSPRSKINDDNTLCDSITKPKQKHFDNNSKTLGRDENGNLLPREVRRQNIIKTHASPQPAFPNKLQDFLGQDNVMNVFSSLTEKNFGKDSQISARGVRLLRNRDVLVENVNDFFKLCYENRIIPTIATLECYLGVEDTSFYAFAKNTSEPNSELVRQVIKQCHAINEVAALHGVIDSHLFTFLAKNYYGLKDITSINLAPTDNNTPNNSDTFNAIKEQIIIEGEEVIK